MPKAPLAPFALRDRPPTPRELEQLRLSLSSYRDGSGQLAVLGGTYPGWRDFERATAAVFGGTSSENKAIFDVEIPGPSVLPYGLSLKTSRLEVGGRQVLMEMSNANAAFWRRLNDLGIDPTKDPTAAGIQLIRVVEEWHQAQRTRVDVASSSYLVLTHDRNFKNWRLFWYPLPFEDPAKLQWEYGGKHLAANRGDDRLWEWYGWSGGQLKYYPRVDRATWSSEPLELDEPPEDNPAAKAKRYWPGQWPS